jgi:mono/diheme cytochrome c family protein
MPTSLRSFLLGVLATLLLLAIGTLAFVWSGRYDIGADAPHTRPVFALMQALRERSIRTHAADLVVPDLSDPQRVLKGAGQYAAMCTQCHLSPAMADSEIRPGLYPQPPNLSRMRVDPKQAFWVIKHGIKMSAMPAWGASHDDATIWSMVAFLQKLPGMSAQEYQDIVARAPPDEDMDMGAEAPATPVQPHHDHDNGGVPDAH